MMILMRIMARVIYIHYFLSDFFNSYTGNSFNRFVYNDEAEFNLLIPIYSYIRPDMGTQFILHILLSLDLFLTEIDLLQYVSLRDSFRNKKLIGRHNDIYYLEQSSNKIFTYFIENQLIYFPNSRSLIDGWIITVGQLFNEVIKDNIILITEMPSVQLTMLMRSNDEKCEIFLNFMRERKF